MEFMSCKCTVTGQALSGQILKKYIFLRGQSYDGAGAMAGRISGVAARVQARYPLAHCFSHLVMVNACQV